ncbi:hypothetical protein ACFVXG_39965 [Kitasatospora sp. NPDC058162]|uniref:hypothetical protein n=1 Tax=Kitasatospora sp. NPDC058162 TaxID=3346362 RepID=UPI0036DB9F10
MRAAAPTSPLGRVTAAAVLAVTALTLSACGANTLQERAKPTITLDQAKTRIDGYLAAIQARLPVQATSLPPAYSDLECDANDIGPHGRRQSSRGYDFGDVSSDVKAKTVTDYRTYLTGQGFQAVPDAAGSHPDWVRMKNPQDGFLAILNGTSDSSHDLTLQVSSPCVWPDGTPPPK